ncbi:hypothetical protein A7K72_10940, partial [Candidatus Methylacidiphilum fumarolicum]|uniref:hypothetical protein n=1 Tax=Candidatus Methylacidiphilum fumarolicum TaxID=591154 RepID=UPI0011004877
PVEQAGFLLGIVRHIVLSGLIGFPYCSLVFSFVFEQTEKRAWESREGSQGALWAFLPVERGTCPFMTGSLVLREKQDF